MSWADDLRCLYCDGKLPLYRKITSGQFCSTAHRKAYWQEQERLAVERLHQTHNSIRAYKPPTPVEAILGPVDPTELSGFAPTHLVPHRQAPMMIVVDPLAYQTELRPTPPVRILPAAICLQPADAGPVPVTWSVAATPARLLLAAPEEAVESAAPQPCRPSEWFEFQPRVRAAKRLDTRLAVNAVSAPLPVPTRVLDPVAVETHPVLCALNVQPARAESISEVEVQEIPRLDRLMPIALRVPTPPPALHCRVEVEMEPAPAAAPAYEIRNIAQHDRWPAAARLLRPGVPAAASPVLVPTAEIEPVAAAAPDPAVLSVVHQVDQSPRAAGMVRPGVPAPSAALASSAAAPQPLEPEISLETPRLTASGERRLTLARPVRLESRARTSAAVPQSSSSLLPVPADVTLPERRGAPGSAAAASPLVQDLAGPVKLRFKIRPAEVSAKPAVSKFNLIPQPPRIQPSLPVCRLEPLDAKPVSDAFLPEPAGAPGSRFSAMAHVWQGAAGFWNHAPRDLKLLTFAIPVLLALAFHPPLPKIRLATHASTGGLKQNVKSAVHAELATMRQAVFERAAVALDEDFRSGLDDWTSQGNATAQWSFDASGFVRPGPLALYRPSMGLTDYQMEFLGLIDKKALSWVVRAADFENYYVVKLEVLKPGPVTTLGITRYAVIHGQAQNRADTLVPISGRADMLYRVRLDVHDEEFALAVQGQMVDDWSEPRLRRGGVGFFSARGEESRLRWVQVTHQYDMLGRLCAYLAPYDTSNTNGSW